VDGLFAPLFLARALPFAVLGEGWALACGWAREGDSVGGEEGCGGAFDAAFGWVRGQHLVVPVGADVAVGGNVVEIAGAGAGVTVGAAAGRGVNRKKKIVTYGGLKLSLATGG